MRDADVRHAVKEMLRELHGSDGESRIVEEMGVWSGSVRIDLAVINGELSGFELKSERDTLRRLPQQAELYSRVFDRITLVAGARHIAASKEKIPDWWGIIIAESEREMVSLNLHREGGLNPSPDPYLVAQLLWKEEALQLLDRLSLARGWRSKTVDLIHQRLADELPFSLLAQYVRETLKQRLGWR